MSYLFSDKKLKNIFEGVPDESILCHTFQYDKDAVSGRPTERLEFFVFKSGNHYDENIKASWDEYTLQFIYMFDFLVFSKKTAMVTNTPDSGNPFNGNGKMTMTVSTPTRSDFEGNDMIKLSMEDSSSFTKMSLRSGTFPIREALNATLQCVKWKRGDQSRSAEPLNWK